MKIISTICAIAFFNIALVLPAAYQTIPSAALDGEGPECEAPHFMHTSGSWIQTLEQYSWPEGQHILFYPNCRELNTKRNWTPLHVAVHHGYTKIVKVLLNNGALVLRDASGKFPYEVDMHPSAADRYFDFTQAREIVRGTKNHAMIFTAGCHAEWAGADFAANPNMREPSTLATPLHLAVAKGDLPLTQELLRHGALLLRNKTGQFPHKLCNGGAATAPEYLGAKNLARTVFQTLSSMHIAALDYNTEAITELAEVNPAIVHAEDQFGRTPLIYLAQSHAYRDQEKHTDGNLLDVVKVLIDLGAKVGREDAFGKSAYAYVAATEVTSTVRDEILTLLN